jgi:hypothetical protein
MASDITSDQPQSAPQAPQGQPVIEAADLAPTYANFARVTGSPEELVLDFGLNPTPFGSPSTPVKVSERLVLNYYTAKRLWAALGMALQRHEQAFGVLETDVNKRVIPQSQRQ